MLVRVVLICEQTNLDLEVVDGGYMRRNIS